ncbi:ASCH domain-containing protein [Ulvibacterium sp.]|uniref:ASCH domain-containing protein n=1 Tax=Ulvibacterium sp. TaxID=2665914 RepID=UPI003CC5BA6D
MKQLTIVLFLIFISCKNEQKIQNEKETDIETQTMAETENGIDKSVYEMWNNYVESNPGFKDQEIPESDFFHNNRKDANRLAELTLKGKKKASSGLLSLYKQYNVDLPKVGAKQIFTDFDGRAQGIIENTRVDTIPFNKISKEYAEMDMGTDIQPLEKWRKAHWDFFESFLKESGEKPTEEMLVVCVRFKTIWPKKY